MSKRRTKTMKPGMKLSLQWNENILLNKTKEIETHTQKMMIIKGKCIQKIEEHGSTFSLWTHNVIFLKLKQKCNIIM